jgi:hypothetical protein
VRTPGKVTAALAGAIASIAVLPAAAGALTLGGVTTKSVDDVAARSVTLKAESTLSVLGASVAFQYGPTTSYGQSSPTVLSALVGVKETISVPVSGLLPNTTYHVRAVAASGLDTVVGRDVTFKTKEEKGKDDGGGTSGSGSGSSGSGSGTSGSSGSGSTGSGTSGSGTSGSSPSTTTSPSSGTSSPSGSGKDDGSSSGSGSGSSASPSDATSAKDSVDPAAAIPAGQATAAITPVLGKTLAVAAVQGTVTATSPAGAPVDLSDARAVPSGTIIDARAGTVELTTALAGAGTTQTGRFWGARFAVHQVAGDRGLTQLVLRGADFHQCQGAAARRVRRAATSKSSKKKKPSRTLWGSDDHGRFQTRGRGSVATVRGTRWMTQDTCEGTLTRVADGAVAVRDFGADRTVVVRKGQEYRARVAP